MVTGAYEAASGTRSAILFMMSGLPAMILTILNSLAAGSAKHLPWIKAKKFHQIRRADCFIHKVLILFKRLSDSLSLEVVHDGASDPLVQFEEHLFKRFLRHEV